MNENKDILNSIYFLPLQTREKINQFSFSSTYFPFTLFSMHPNGKKKIVHLEVVDMQLQNAYYMLNIPNSWFDMQCRSINQDFQKSY